MSQLIFVGQPRCSCGYTTKNHDEFCDHLAAGWNDLRVEHEIKFSNK